MISRLFRSSCLVVPRNAEISRQSAILIEYVSILLIALFMSVVNVITAKWHILMDTGLFSIFMIIILYVSFLCYKRHHRLIFKIMVFLFFIGSAGMLTFFAILGESEDFAILWILIVPVFSILFLNFGEAILLDILMLFVICLIFWTSWGRSILNYEYSDVFRMRFPFLYMTFFVSSLTLHQFFTARFNILITAKSKTLKDLYRLSYIDSVTKGHTFLYFSGHFKSTVASLDRNKIHFFGVANIRYFSEFNILFGEEVGHKTLRYYYKLLDNSCFGVKLLCRDNVDNFYFVMEKDSIEQAQMCFSNMSDRLDDFSKDMVDELNSYPYHLMVYIGFVIINNNTNDSIRQLIDKARMAVFDRSRLEPLRNSLEIFLYGKDDIRRYYHSLFVLQNIQDAFANNEFILSSYESAVTNIYSCRLVWIHNGNRIYDYEDSLAVFGLRVEHDKYLVRKCCEYLCDEWKTNPDMKMILHLQPRTKSFLYQDGWFENTCAQYKVNPSSLMLS